MSRTILLAVVVAAAGAGEARAQGRVKAAREAAEWLVGRFGAKAGRSVPELAGRIESLAARYGDDAIAAVRKGGPSACGLVEPAGPDGAKAVRVLLVRGEQGASRVPSRPAAMRQLARHGDEAAAVLVRHPGVAEPLLERCGAQAVQALLANPEPFLNVPRDLAAAAGDGVVEPVVVGITNVLLGTWAVVAVLIAAAAVVAREHGLPGPEAVKSVAAVFRK